MGNLVRNVTNVKYHYIIMLLPMFFVDLNIEVCDSDILSVYTIAN